jgi:hypothetical protein
MIPIMESNSIVSSKPLFPKRKQRFLEKIGNKPQKFYYVLAPIHSLRGNFEERQLTADIFGDYHEAWESRAECEMWNEPIITVTSWEIAEKLKNVFESLVPYSFSNSAPSPDDLVTCRQLDWAERYIERKRRQSDFLGCIFD